MTILIIDNVEERLNSLFACLGEIFPSAVIKAEQDPYDAGKYCLFHPVDMVFTELEPGKMDALQLKGFINHMNPAAKIYITGNLQSLYDWEIIDENNGLIEQGVSGVLIYPITPEKLRSALTEETGGVA